MRSDLDDTQGGTTAEGIHLGAMAGSVDVLQRCYLGIETSNNVIWFDPVLPTEVRSLSVDICYRQRWMHLAAADGQFTVELAQSSEGAVLVGLDGVLHELSPGDLRQMML